MISVLIIGFGNSLRTDDGVGWHVAQELSRVVDTPGVEIISCGQLTPDLAEPVSRAHNVIFIDAAQQWIDATQQRRVGEPRWERLAPAPAPSNFSHQLSPVSLLTLARDLYGYSPEASLITIPGESFTFGDSLSPAVAAHLPRLIDDIREFISRSMGRSSVALSGYRSGTNVPFQ